MSDSSPKQISWPRILVEGLVIIVSILLALAADAWWTGRQLRSDEHDVLQLLDAEFAEVELVLEQWQQNHQLILDASVELLEHTGPVVSNPPSTERIAYLLWNGILLVWGVDPPVATLDSLESSGRLVLIRNQEILSGLAYWRSLLTDLQEDEAVLKSYSYDTIMPYLTANVAWREISALTEDTLFVGTPSQFDNGFLELLTQREFEGYVDARRTETINILENYRILRSNLRELRSLIQAELDDF